jgi:hypothetical protein
MFVIFAIMKILRWDIKKLNTEQVHLKALQNHLKENLVIQKNIYYKNKLYEKANTCWSPGVRSLFRQPIAPMAHYSDSPFHRQPIIPSKMVKSSIIILKPVVFLLYLTED